jgi:predicted Zn finger-like uncharacterized protein
MSLVTCCPACGTMFKVVPDQLRISHGWVRCGHCSEVFDAAANMQPRAVSSVLLAPDASAPTVLPPSASAAVRTSPLVAPSAPVPTHEPPSEPNDPRSTWTPLTIPPSSRTSTTAPLAEQATRSQPDASVFTKDIAEAQPGSSLPMPPRQATAMPSPVLTRESAPDSEPFETLHSIFHETSEVSVSPDVSFVRQARRQAFWQGGWVRSVLLLLLLLGLATWALQVVHHERNRLAAKRPELKPWLEQLCEYTRCTVGAVRQIDSIVVDNSSFNKLRPDTYRLSLSLKNQAALPLAMPAVELTLTDAQDQPVLRRVLLPGDLGSKTGVIDASGEWSSAVVINVAGREGSSRDSNRIIGYRVLAFYP